MSKALYHLCILGVLAILLNPAFSFTQDIQYISANPNNVQTELKHVGLLILSNGKVEETGYMRFPLKILNEGSLTTHQNSRLKKWDTFDVISKDFFLSLSISDLGPTGSIRATFFDYNTGRSKVITTSTTRDTTPRLSYTSYRYTNGTADDIEFQNNDISFKVENLGTGLGSRYHGRKVNIASSSHDFSVNFKVNVSSDHESIATITPIDSTHEYFYYDVSTGNIPVEGSLTVDGKQYSFDSESAASGHNYGRGVWADRSYIVKARGQTFLPDGRRFSLFLNSGYGDADTTVATGDAFILDRFMYKLNAVNVELNESNLMQPIKFRTLFNQNKNFKECRVVFTPSHVEERAFGEGSHHAASNLVIGTFSGYVTDYKNKKYRFDDMKGSVEVTKMKLEN